MRIRSWKSVFYFIPTYICIFTILTKAEDVTVVMKNESTSMTVDALTEVNYSTVSTTPISELSTQTPPMNTTEISTLSNANNTSTRPPEISSLKPIQKQTEPTDCSQREESRNQPKFTTNSRLRKCCPLGENLDYYRENQSDSMCDNAALKFEPTIISAMLYDNCIEDLEITPELPIEIGNPCNNSFQYDDTEDAIFVMQNGALLLINKNGTDYVVEENYCLDQDRSGKMIAFVCISQVEEISQAKIITIAVLMLISMPCLLLVSYLHLTLKLLRNLHGWSLALMSLCLACGYFVYSVVHIYGIPSGGFIGYVIQFFILSFYFWYLCICCNVLLNIWFKLPYYIQLNNTWTILNFTAYLFIAITGPAIMVSLTVQKGLPGMPSYFLQGLTESIRESQRYFIPPVSTILGLSFLVMVIAFFGFQRIKSDGYLRAHDDEKDATTPILEFDVEKYENVKKDAKCVALLGIIIILAWLFEIVTFYKSGNEVYLLLCDMINGLQGLWIMLIFLVVRRRRTIILRWWYDRGSHTITEAGTELQPVNKAANPS
ncbi:probable G-protein coupled receptor Mth-like 14 isoform X2 [Drosophila innubila]|uniref:probable G-protein coupled receptor Mth-like 14 isoform X2 n=1 Tax=Drosophila innubila TaxID=198719 RepID=UPI00148CDB37|nr:probable G-protein coupled receptor Mth-like 14 isoform X2 [Drosophila innubila]